MLLHDASVRSHERSVAIDKQPLRGHYPDGSSEEDIEADFDFDLDTLLTDPALFDALMNARDRRRAGHDGNAPTPGRAE